MDKLKDKEVLQGLIYGTPGKKKVYVNICWPLTANILNIEKPIIIMIGIC